jgi:hypothetical protein
MDFHFEAAVEVSFAEDLSYTDVAPLLDALSETAIFRVRTSRVGWSGPAAGGPELGLIITAAGAVGASAFAKTFCEELAKDVYRGVRAGINAAARRLRSKAEPRAVVPLVIEVGAIRLCLGSLVQEEPAAGEWTDAWLIERLREAQAIVDASPDLAEADPPFRSIEVQTCDHWLR